MGDSAVCGLGSRKLCFLIHGRPGNWVERPNEQWGGGSRPEEPRSVQKRGGEGGGQRGRADVSAASVRGSRGRGLPARGPGTRAVGAAGPLGRP